MDEKVRRHFLENRLWHGSRMFLPEHRVGTVELYEAESNKVHLPSPTQERLEEIQDLILWAQVRKEVVRLSVVRDGRLDTISGAPVSVWRLPGVLELLDGQGQKVRVKIGEIVDAE